MADQKKTVKHQRTFRQILSDTSFGDFVRSLKKLFESNSRKIYIILAIEFMAELLITGWIAALIAKSNREISYIGLGSLLGFGFRHILIVLIEFLVLGCYTIWKMAAYRSTVHYDEVKGIHVSENQEAGSAGRMMDGPEKEATFEISHAFETKELFLGADADHPENLLSILPIRNMNFNRLVVGPPGSGKTRCLVYNMIFQIIRRGESLIVTDTKGEIYGRTVMIAKAHGYKTKYINLNPYTMVHSDAVNLFTPATKSDLSCLQFAQAVVDNLGEEREVGYWPKAEKNLLTAVMLNRKDFCPSGEPEKRSLTGCAELLNSNTSAQLVTEFDKNKVPGSQMTACASNWANSAEKARDDAKAGLGMGLTSLINPTIGSVLGLDDVDLTLPGKEKCIYYVNLCDSDPSMHFASALYFKEQISELEALADAQPNNRLPITTHLLLEEMANLGRIPGFDTIISTVRSRGMPITIILQGFEQLASLYPDGKSDTIINDCDIHLFLGTNSLNTAKYYQERAGEVPVVTRQKSVHGEKTSRLFKIHPEYDDRTTESKRHLYSINELMGLEETKMLLFIRQRKKVTELLRVDYSTHPMSREIREINAAYHMPDWVRDRVLNSPIEMSKHHVSPADFKTEEQLLREAGFNPDDEPYICDDEEFSEFRDPEHDKLRHRKHRSGSSGSTSGSAPAQPAPQPQAPASPAVPPAGQPAPQTPAQPAPVPAAAPAQPVQQAQSVPQSQPSGKGKGHVPSGYDISFGDDDDDNLFY